MLFFTAAILLRAVQNQGIILKGYTIFFYFISAFQYTNLLASASREPVVCTCV